MKRKKIYILLVLYFVLFLGIDNIKARTCEYGDGSFILETSKGSNEKYNVILKNKDMLTDKKNKLNYKDVLLFVDGNQITNDKQCFASIRSCSYSYTIPAFLWGSSVKSKSEKYLGIFGSALDPETIDNKYAQVFSASTGITDRIWSIFFKGTDNDCVTFTYTGDDKEDLKKENNLISYCDKFVSLYTDIVLAYSQYSDCDNIKDKGKTVVSSCKSTALSKINKGEEKLRNTCNSLLQNSSVTSEDGCAISCLNHTETLKQLRKQKIKGSEILDCSLSQNVLGFILNILNFVKYIIPVLVIILGILDFIRAIASDKDDEMKKAQKRFITRLIAAALVFIVPLIIVFVLEALGFPVEGCGIIKI